MASDRLADLEAKIQGLLELTRELKRRNAHLEERLRRWEKERDWLRGRVTKALTELNSIEPEGARDSSRA
jgi:uncharacterized coiled-coil DUF342 family protein